MPASTVHIVHCIDTEGPFFEPLEETFFRIENLYGLKITPNKDNLLALSKGEISTGDHDEEISCMISSVLKNLDSWDKIAHEWEILCSKNFREKVIDSFAGGWVYNWFTMDHVGYQNNPRGRDIGFHNIFSKYKKLTENIGNERDGLHFHFHPMPFDRQANHSATHYFSHNDSLFQILARRLIDFEWFPSCYRPGFHITRPDSHWFLEQFIPFDFSNQRYLTDGFKRIDQITARFEDWRRAPNNWQPYHPDHDDYQKEGACRRYIARCLNVGARYRNIYQEDVNQAFEEAAKGLPVIMAFTNHDYRCMREDIESVQQYLQVAQEKYPEVPFRFCEAKEAFQRTLGFPLETDASFNFYFEENVLHIQSSHKIFGPQPFFAIKTKGGQYYHDNLDFEKPFLNWSYTFDEHNFMLNQIESIGVAACTDQGHVITKLKSFPSQNTKAN